MYPCRHDLTACHRKLDVDCQPHTIRPHRTLWGRQVEVFVIFDGHGVANLAGTLQTATGALMAGCGS